MPSTSLTFPEYLSKYSHLSDELQGRLVSIVEEDLAGVLRQWVVADFGNVWDGRYDHNFYERAQNSILNNQECRDALGEEFDIYNQTLKCLALYLEWRKQKAGLGSTGKKRKKSQAGKPAENAQPPVAPLTEGELKEMHAVKHERNQEARAQCIAHYRQTHDGRILCECCGFDFGKVYGELGEGFIEVHHLSPISQQDEAHVIDPVKDLVPLCANCHAMIHRVLTRKHCEGLESLKELEDMMKQGELT